MGPGAYDLEEIRRRADLAEIISPHVALRRAGRRLVGLCPFHQERTPSFTVDAERGLWYCFGCRAGGDVFKFVEMIERVPFSEAVEVLARRLGVPPRPGADQAERSRRERMLALHAAAAQHFQSRLASPAGRHAVAYLRRRGLTRATAERFGLGYAPDSWDDLLAAMGKLGFSPEELGQAGLAVRRDDGSGFYDRFRNRVLFPIRDAAGRIIAFGGRALADDQQPKYLNSPETPIFQKGRALYAFDIARRAMADAGRALIVEGYLDAIACHDAGLTETVATMGTALTADHVELLRRHVAQLALAFDSDSAGLAAALRSRQLFQDAGLDVRVVTLPPGADPDRVVRDRGGDALRSLVASAVPIVEWELERILSRLRDDQRGVQTLREAIRSLAGVPPGVEREYYIRWLAQRWGDDSPSHVAATEAAIREELGRLSAGRPARGRRTAQSASAQPPQTGKPAGNRLQAGLLAALLEDPALAARYAPELEGTDFADENHRRVFDAISALLARGETVTARAVLAELAPEARGALAELAVGDLPREKMAAAAAAAVRRLVEARLRRGEAALRQRLEGAKSAEEREAILREKMEFSRRRSELAQQRVLGDQ